ncbi:MAG: TIGR02281 family clan AA aspartic protease [Paracoccaceae bacterium]
MTDFGPEQFLPALFLTLILIACIVSLGGQRMHKTLQHAAIWGLIFVGAIAAVGVWDDIRDDVMPRQTAFVSQGRIEVPRHFDGHYYVTLDVNGAPVQFVVDTGATDIVLTKEDAARAGIDVANLQFFGRANTANGTVRTAGIRLDQVSIDGIVDRNLSASVNGGEMFGSLLGMTYLQRWDKIEISNGTLVLTRQ